MNHRRWPNIIDPCCQAGQGLGDTRKAKDQIRSTIPDLGGDPPRLFNEARCSIWMSLDHVNWSTMAMAQESPDDEEADSSICPWKDEFYRHLLCGPISISMYSDFDLDVIRGKSQGDRMTEEHIAACHCDVDGISAGSI